MRSIIFYVIILTVACKTMPQVMTNVSDNIVTIQAACGSDDSLAMILVKSKFWRTYQLNGKLLKSRDIKHLYVVSGDPKLLRDYRLGKFTMWGGSAICFVVTFAALRYNGTRVPAYIGIPCLFATFEIPHLIGRNKFEGTISRYNEGIVCPAERESKDE